MEKFGVNTIFDIDVIRHQLLMASQNDLNQLKELINNYQLKPSIPKNKTLFAPENSFIWEKIISMKFFEKIIDRKYDEDMIYTATCTVLFDNDTKISITSRIRDNETSGASGVYYYYKIFSMNNSNEGKIRDLNDISLDIACQIFKNKNLEMATIFESFIERIEAYLCIKVNILLKSETGYCPIDIKYNDSEKINYRKTMDKILN